MATGRSLGRVYWQWWQRTEEPSGADGGNKTLPRVVSGLRSYVLCSFEVMIRVCLPIVCVFTLYSFHDSCMKS